MADGSITPQRLRLRIADVAKRYDEQLRFDLIESELLTLVGWANASNANNAIFVEEALNALFDPATNFPELARFSVPHLQRADLRDALSKRLAETNDERTRACLRSILGGPDKYDGTNVASTHRT